MALSHSPTIHERQFTVAPKSGGNPEGKGVNGFLADWRATQPRDTVAKPQRQVLAEMFTSMLILSSSFKYRPVAGRPNYLYWMNGQWSLSLVGPDEWSDERRAAFAGTCTLQPDMTWTIAPCAELVNKAAVAAAIRRYFRGFADMLDTELTLEEVLPFYAGGLPYFQRLHANALSRSLRASVVRGQQTAIRCRDWREQLPEQSSELLAHGGRG